MYSSFSHLNNISCLKSSNARQYYGVYANPTVSDPLTLSFEIAGPIINAVTDSFTIEFFIKNTQNSSSYADPGKTILTIGKNGIDPEIKIAYGNQAINRLQMYTNNGINRYSTRRANFNGGATAVVAWHHVAFVYTGNNSTTGNYIYVDGTRATGTTGFAETTACEYVNGINDTNATAYRVSTILTESTTKYIGLLGYAGVAPSFVNDMNTPIYNLRITKGAVYTGSSFTVPTRLDVITNCLFCLDSYIENGTHYIKDLVSNIDLPRLALDTVDGFKP